MFSVPYLCILLLALLPTPIGGFRLVLGTDQKLPQWRSTKPITPVPGEGVDRGEVRQKVGKLENTTRYCREKSVGKL